MNSPRYRTKPIEIEILSDVQEWVTVRYVDGPVERMRRKEFDWRFEPVPAVPADARPTPHMPDRCVERRGLATGAAESAEHGQRVALEQNSLALRRVADAIERFARSSDARAWLPQLIPNTRGDAVDRVAERFVTVIDAKTRSEHLGELRREDNAPRVVTINAHENDRVVVNGMPVWPPRADVLAVMRAIAAAEIGESCQFCGAGKWTPSIPIDKHRDGCAYIAARSIVAFADGQ